MGYRHTERTHRQMRGVLVQAQERGQDEPASRVQHAQGTPRDVHRHQDLRHHGRGQGWATHSGAEQQAQGNIQEEEG